MSNRTAVVGQGHEVISRSSALLIAVLCVSAAPSVVSTAAAQNTASISGQWEVPRTPNGHPDLQGNWTNQSMTPFQRRADQDRVYTPEEVADIEQGYVDRAVRGSQPSDPDRPAPPSGQGVGTYNNVFFETGSRVAVVNGEPRTSLITYPSNGRLPALSEEGEQRRQERRDGRSNFEQYDHPELRPLAERCLTSYGSPAGPPMIPNGGYNSNYIIVQTPDHVMIMTEMVHDTRIIRIGDGPKLPEHIRPWMGDSWGHWEGDVLVVETTNIHPLQPYSSPDMHVTERFSRMSEDAILYEFTVDDPATYEEPWSGQIPMMAMPDQIYEYACQEGNYALSAVLSGARYQERMEAEETNDARRD